MKVYSKKLPQRFVNFRILKQNLEEGDPEKMEELACCRKSGTTDPNQFYDVILLIWSRTTRNDQNFRNTIKHTYLQFCCVFTGGECHRNKHKLNVSEFMSVRCVELWTSSERGEEELQSGVGRTRTR